MVYLFESKLNEKKSVKVSIQSVFGIGPSLATKLVKMSGFSDNLTVSELTPNQLKDLNNLILDLDLKITNKLKKQQGDSKKKLINIKSYRGLRKLKGLPVRGQRTHTNAKSSKRTKFKL